MKKLSLVEVLKEAEGKLPLKHYKKDNQVSFDDMTRFVDDEEELNEAAPQAPPELSQQQYAREYKNLLTKLNKLKQEYQMRPSPQLQAEINRLQPVLGKLSMGLTGYSNNPKKTNNVPTDPAPYVDVPPLV